MQPDVVVTEPRTLRRQIATLAVAAWVLLCVVAGGYLLASHLLTLPIPAVESPALHRAITAHRGDHQRDRWLVLHVVYDGCRCSRQVLDHLLASSSASPGASSRPADLAERVVLITDSGTAPAATTDAIRAHGFELEVVSAARLVERYGIEAAPLLVIVDPTDHVRYVGGYTPRKQAADIRDLAVIDAVRRGVPVAPLPAFGCAIGKELRAQLDPLGIRTPN